MLLIHQLRGSVKDLSSWVCTNPPAQGMAGTRGQSHPSAMGQLGHSTCWVLPGLGSSSGLGTQMCPSGTKPHSQRAFGPIMEGGSTPSGSASSWHNRHPESGTTRSTRWHLCDPEGPWQGEKATEDSQFLREGWFKVFPLHFLAQEGRAHCWQSLSPHLPTSKLSQSPLSPKFPKGRGENQDQQTEGQLELHLVLKRIDKSCPHQ